MGNEENKGIDANPKKNKGSFFLPMSELTRKFKLGSWVAEKPAEKNANFRETCLQKAKVKLNGQLKASWSWYHMARGGQTEIQDDGTYRDKSKGFKPQISN